MIEATEDRFRLTIPLRDAVCFAMGWSDLGYEEPSETLRQVVGFLSIDALEYSEQWRAAALVRARLQSRSAEAAE